jgi:hypothetical protein
VGFHSDEFIKYSPLRVLITPVEGVITQPLKSRERIILGAVVSPLPM